MITKWKTHLMATLLLAAPAWAANPAGLDADVPVKEVLTKTTEQAKALEEQIETLSKSVRELQADFDRVQAERERSTPVGGPNDHPLWP